MGSLRYGAGSGMLRVVRLEVYRGKCRPQVLFRRLEGHAPQGRRYPEYEAPTRTLGWRMYLRLIVDGELPVQELYPAIVEGVRRRDHVSGYLVVLL